MRRLGLLGGFAARSLALTLVMAAVLGGVTSWLMRDAMLTESGRALRVPVEAIVRSSLSDSDYSGPLTGSTLAEFDSAVKRQLVGGDLVGLKVVNGDHVTVYSTVASEIGKTYPDKQEVDKALEGQTVSQVEGGSKAGERSLVAKYGTLAETCAPVRSSTDGRIVGVYEVYHRYAPIAAAVTSSLWIIWGCILLGASGIYFTQVAMVRGATRRLQQSESDADATRSRLDASLRDLQAHTVGTLQALVTAVDAKDSYTASHSLGVADCARIVGRRLGLSEEQLLVLEKAALLHDIGKIGVPERILLKPGPLTADEVMTVREHSHLGAQIAESVPFLEEVAPIIAHHHERWDGAGYPDGLRGGDIPLLSRVLAVADAYDAMSSDRPYRTGLKWFRVRQQLRRESGGQFDPQMVTALIEALRAGDVPHEGRHEAMAAESAS